MHNLYTVLPLTLEQKFVYLRLIGRLVCADSISNLIEKKYIQDLMRRFQFSVDDIKNISVYSPSDELKTVLQPIQGRKMALDLLHCLWFVASIDDNIADHEITIIRQTANILGINENEVLKLNGFVQDEIAFLRQAQEVLSAEKLAY